MLFIVYEIRPTHVNHYQLCKPVHVVTNQMHKVASGVWYGFKVAARKTSCSSSRQLQQMMHHLKVREQQQRWRS